MMTRRQVLALGAAAPFLPRYRGQVDDADWENWNGLASVNLPATSSDPFVLVPGQDGMTWRVTAVSIQLAGLIAPGHTTGRAGVWFDSPQVSLVHTVGFDVTGGPTRTNAYPPIWTQPKASRNPAEAILCGFTPDPGSGLCSGGRAYFRVTYEAA